MLEKFLSRSLNFEGFNSAVFGLITVNFSSNTFWHFAFSFVLTLWYVGGGTIGLSISLWKMEYIKYNCDETAREFPPIYSQLAESKEPRILTFAEASGTFLGALSNLTLLCGIGNCTIVSIRGGALKYLPVYKQ